MFSPRPDSLRERPRESWWGALEVGGSCLERVASVRAYTDCRLERALEGEGGVPWYPKVWMVFVRDNPVRIDDLGVYRLFMMISDG